MSSIVLVGRYRLSVGRGCVCVGRRWFTAYGAGVVLALGVLVGGCGGSGSPGSGGSGGTTDPGDNALPSEPLSFNGTLSGTIADTQTTRASTTDTSAAQALPSGFDPADTVVRFMDLVGDPLVAPDGTPMPAVPLGSDGSFTAENLPVGADIVVCADVGDDGTCDIEGSANIPSVDGGTDGAITDLRTDPLTTLILAKLRALVAARGIDMRDLPVSPVAIATRIVEAYTHMFEETGIDGNVSFDEIEAITGAQLAALFETVVPAGAQTGMHMAEGSLDMARAADAQALALSAAEVFLRAGFPIADPPGHADFSALASLPDVTTTTMRELFDNGGGPFDDEFVPRQGDAPLMPAAADLAPFDTVPVYMTTVAEPDRNRGVGEDEGPEDVSRLPVLNDYLLMRMAELKLEGRLITLEDLYQLLTSLDDGLGARLTYVLFDPNFHGPPLNVFETADGAGTALSLDEIFSRVFNDGFFDVDPESFAAREAELRSLLTELLAGTVPPAYPRLFAAFGNERIEGIQQLANRIRDARVHLPFSRSGPSQWFVVADGDAFAPNSTATAVTVDADVSVDGEVVSVTFNASGTGQYYLGFTGETDTEGFVELIVRETGRVLHGKRGPSRLKLDDASVFQPIDGAPFADFVTESGTFYPGTNVSVIRADFAPAPFEPPFEPGPMPPDQMPPDQMPPDQLPPDQLPPDQLPPDQLPPDQLPPDQLPPDQLPPDQLPPDTTPGDGGVVDPAQVPPAGPNDQIFVLAVAPGGEPVHVDYDPATGVATFNPGGRHLLMFTPESEATGLFVLFNEEIGQPAGTDDPTTFFAAPPEQPMGFEDIFNGVDDFGMVDDLGGLIGDLPFDPFDPTQTPPPGFPPPGDLPFPPPPGGGLPPGAPPLNPGDVPVDPAAGPDGFDPTGLILVSAESIVGLDVFREGFTRVFGTDVPNQHYDPSGDPFYDDINDNDVHDPDEPTGQFRPMLFNLNDWRSTDLRLYYRRADTNGAIGFEDVDFSADTPLTLDGVALVPRNYKPRLNAFRFGRPNTAINLLTAFLPPEFFDGTHLLVPSTKVDVFSAIAIINLVMDQVFNVEADIDIDGVGPLPKKHMVIDAHMFVAPVGDPFVLLLKGFADRSVVAPPTQ